MINKLDWNIGQEIDGLIKASDVKNGRPHPEMIHLAISKCGLKESSRVAKVGDFVIHIKVGLSAECGYIDSEIQAAGYTATRLNVPYGATDLPYSKPSL